MPNITKVLKNDRQLRALTGIGVKEFALLSNSFAQLLYENLVNKRRQRKIGGGRKGTLIGAQSKLFFVLFYCKVYPTYDVCSFIFGADSSRCCRWVKELMNLVEKALGRNLVLPKRQIRSIDELLEICPEAKDLFIDGTERRTQRPKKPKLKTKRYSGKKKIHTRKNTVISDDSRRIIFVSPTNEGRIHDLHQLKKTGVLEHIPKDRTIWVDKGYQGIKSVLRNNNQIMMPHKKPKGKLLDSGQRSENRIISGIRIVVEHAIGGIKRFGVMSGIYRNRRGQDDQMIGVCSGLWNLHLQYANC